MKDKATIYVIANAAGGGNAHPGLSGGDRIIIECVNRWSAQGHKITLFISKSGHMMFERYGTMSVNYVITSSLLFEKYSLVRIFFFEVLSLVKGCLAALRVRGTSGKVIVYSVSDFWPDAIPGFILSRKIRNSKWVASLNLFAPHPFRDALYKGRRRLRGLLFYLSQKPIYWLEKRHADIVFVTSEPDRWKFIGNRLTPDRVIALLGGVDAKTPPTVPEPEEKRYDAVFIGRFHPQKGVMELVDIWNHVCQIRKGARLAMIGVGELEKEIQAKIIRHGLEDNIELLGFQDGIPKFQIFKSSRIVLHPAVYDSGGMAACEAMACGLPGVGFDLEALKTYYPKGMLKTPCFDFKAFAQNVIELLEDKELYEKTKQDALDWAAECDWDIKAQRILNVLLSEGKLYTD